MADLGELHAHLVHRWDERKTVYAEGTHSIDEVDLYNTAHMKMVARIEAELWHTTRGYMVLSYTPPHKVYEDTYYRYEVWRATAEVLPVITEEHHAELA